MYDVKEAAEYMAINTRRFQYLIYNVHRIKPDQTIKGKNMYTLQTLDNLKKLAENGPKSKEQRRQTLKEQHIKSIRAANLEIIGLGDLRHLTYIVSVLKRLGAIPKGE